MAEGFDPLGQYGTEMSPTLWTCFLRGTDVCRGLVVYTMKDTSANRLTKDSQINLHESQKSIKLAVFMRFVQGLCQQNY